VLRRSLTITRHEMEIKKMPDTEKMKADRKAGLARLYKCPSSDDLRPMSD
jgi:hypothetical protein